MSDPFAAAERFTLAYFAGGEELMDGRRSADIFTLAAGDLGELIADGPIPALVGILHVLDTAVDLAAHLADADRATIVRRIVAVAEHRRTTP